MLGAGREALVVGPAVVGFGHRGVLLRDAAAHLGEQARLQVGSVPAMAAAV